MKHIFIPLTAFVIIIGILVLTSDKKMGENPLSEQEKKDLCYEERFRAPEATIPEGEFDRTILRFNGVVGYTTGVYSWIPYGKDSGRGLIQGAFADESQTLWTGTYTYSIEGSVQKSEVSFKITPQGVAVGRGELVEDSSEGILRFKDPTTLRYDQLLSPVECSVIAEEASLIPPNISELLQ